MPDPALLHNLLDMIRARPIERLFVLGICGAQGSGKSTLVAALADRLAREGIAAAMLSLDDLYRTRAERQALAREVHPLFATRGVPGTHDVALGLEVVDALARGEGAALPRFAKGQDDRLPRSAWPLAPAATQVLLLEGWCLGARPQDPAALAEPANALEAQEDPGGIWRRHANAALAGPYQDLFARIDRLVLLAAPDWQVVAQWREQQEAELRATGAALAMTGAEVQRFIQHYERLTRWILLEMPQRADLVVQLDHARGIVA
ncbi:kinase [Novosphingobium sp.]|uniref:kinase n=1 Tax=Novosphingobium sp. TaxID=1874826 RepID=UPI0025F21C79|nr:kinase [Novosphingobium sp.]MCC6924481.1 kinase [Novosphingobium sp.]